MLSAALNFSSQPQIVAIDFLGLLTMPLLKKESRQRVTRRVHPGPRLDVLQVIIETNTFPQILIRSVIIALVIIQFAVEHLLADRQDGTGWIVEESPLWRNSAETVVKAPAFLFGFWKILQEGMGYGFRVMVHGRRDWIEFTVIG